MSKRALRKWYGELWDKFLAAESDKERRIIADQAHRIFVALGARR